mmetsp:Transcript_6592/g.17217  ORF Transcript_6592/g.17217 Transcript_6592/m.17217 type:complete len:313 (-) Transcript_6592:90-1028(-)
MREDDANADDAAEPQDEHRRARGEEILEEIIDRRPFLRELGKLGDPEDLDYLDDPAELEDLGRFQAFGVLRVRIAATGGSGEQEGDLDHRRKARDEIQGEPRLEVVDHAALGFHYLELVEADLLHKARPEVQDQINDEKDVDENVDDPDQGVGPRRRLGEQPQRQRNHEDQEDEQREDDQVPGDSKARIRRNHGYRAPPTIIALGRHRRHLFPLLCLLRLLIDRGVVPGRLDLPGLSRLDVRPSVARLTTFFEKFIQSRFRTFLLRSQRRHDVCQLIQRRIGGQELDPFECVTHAVDGMAEMLRPFPNALSI